MKITILKGERVDVASIQIANDQQTNTYEFVKVGASITGVPFTVNGVPITLPPIGKFACIEGDLIPVVPLGTLSYTSLHGVEKEIDLLGGVAFDHNGNYWVAVKS
ncbi:hypothetical protein UFOVP1106_42 [uncultured Caudovirales phage]|uniref:Uncharacterized protein n=1 Tax=uncultured Caudovirales phage TaxID=2100421 RepID=A0A6J5QG27_9CAUD|nr:hypothetical protein UFOVP1106_42 [uncultured Caudovirales phage]